jgi:hypothetical protein
MVDRAQRSPPVVDLQKSHSRYIVRRLDPNPHTSTARQSNGVNRGDGSGLRNRGEGVVITHTRTLYVLVYVCTPIGLGARKCK